MFSFLWDECPSEIDGFMVITCLIFKKPVNFSRAAVPFYTDPAAKYK